MVTAAESTSPPHPTGTIMQHRNVSKVRKWESQAQLLPLLAGQNLEPARGQRVHLPALTLHLLKSEVG